MTGVKEIGRKPRIQHRMSIEYGRSPLPNTAVMPPAPIFYTRRRTMNPETHVILPQQLSDDKEYSRYRVPVTKPRVAPSFITALEVVIEESEFSLRWESSAASGRIRIKTVEISDDRPAVAYLHRDWSKKRANLGVRRTSQHSRTTAISHWPGQLLTITRPFWSTHDCGIDTFPSAAFQYS